jgi:HD-GYP domain-containing protein (c-di-GMP phosphodiesterase class II)
MGLGPDLVEDVRAASLLHDIGNIKTSRDLLEKASKLTRKEYDRLMQQAERGTSMLEPVGGRIHRIIPIILAHQEATDGTTTPAKPKGELPLEARIIAVADAYDTMTSDRRYRRGISAFDAKENILKGAGSDFDEEVVHAFNEAFRENEMEVREPLLQNPV